ncbi:MAG: hypothetical protein ACOYJU_02775 [Anaerovoracaceae bacterium]
MDKIEHVIEGLNQILWADVPDILKGLIIALVVAALFKKQIKTHSWIFYLFPALMFFLCVAYGIMDLVKPALLEKITEDTAVGSIFHILYGDFSATAVGIGFIIIVMFVGVLPKNKFVVSLFSIRKELSIIGGAFLVGHAVLRFSTAFNSLKNPADELFFVIYGILGFVLLIIFAIPWITSFDCIRKKMSPQFWKKHQTYTAVPAFILMLTFGLLLNLAWTLYQSPNLLQSLWEVKAIGDYQIDNLGIGHQFGNMQLSIRVYLFLLVSYICLRYRRNKARQEKKA